MEGGGVVRFGSIISILTGVLISSASVAEPLPGAPAAIPGALPPDEITTIVRSSGLHPLGPPAARGPTYILRAADRRAEIVRVVIDARSGDIMSVVPVVEGPRGIAAGGPPPPYRPGVRVSHPEGDQMAPSGPRPTTTRPPREVAATPPAGPPLPRPRPVPPSGSRSTPDEAAKSPDAEPKPDHVNKPKLPIYE
jgi:hypothetical protein